MNYSKSIAPSSSGQGYGPLEPGTAVRKAFFFSPKRKNPGNKEKIKTG